MTMPVHSPGGGAAYRSPQRRTRWMVVVLAIVACSFALFACADKRTAEQRAADDRAEAIAAIERIIPETERQSAVIALYDRWELLVHDRQRANATYVAALRTLNADYSATPAAFAALHQQRDDADARFMGDALAIRSRLQQAVNEPEWKHLGQARAIARSHMPKLTEETAR